MKGRGNLRIALEVSCNSLLSPDDSQGCALRKMWGKRHLGLVIKILNPAMFMIWECCKNEMKCAAHWTMPVQSSSIVAARNQEHRVSCNLLKCDCCF